MQGSVVGLIDSASAVGALWAACVAEVDLGGQAGAHGADHRDRQPGGKTLVSANLRRRMDRQPESRPQTTNVGARPAYVVLLWLRRAAAATLLATVLRGKATMSSSDSRRSRCDSEPPLTA